MKMPYVYLILSVFMSASGNILGKLFNTQNNGCKDSGVFYNFLQMLCVFLCWCVLYAFDFSFDIGVLLYAILFAACYTACNIGVINALKHGPTALTSLFTSLSLIVTTLWGFAFWDETLAVTVVIGLLLDCLAIVLCLYSKKKEKKGVSWKWLGYAVLAMVGNAGCSIIQRTQQMQFHGAHGKMLMAFATFFAALFCLIRFLQSNKSDAVTMMRKSWWTPALASFCNVVLNALVMLMALTELPASLIYPVIGVGTLCVVTIFSLFFFKEKMHWRQWLGISFGAIAVVLLSI